ncbi:hypothetical protein V8E54_000534 [Elaphomyces granulatus]
MKTPTLDDVEPLHFNSLVVNRFYWVRFTYKSTTYILPCLLLRLLEDSESALVLLANTHPQFSDRWIPFPNSPSLPGQPPVSVAVSPPGPFASGERYYLCYTHVLHAKPVIRCAEKPETPSLPPSEVVCTNTDEILTHHRRYWASRGGVSPKPKENKDTPEDGTGPGGDGGNSNEQSGVSSIESSTAAVMDHLRTITI